MIAAAGMTGPRRARWGRTLPLLTVLALVTAELLTPTRPARADGPPAAQFVPAMVAAYGQTGTLAVAVVPVQRRVSGLGLWTLATHITHGALATGDNGAAAARPFPTASMVKLFMAEDILHRARAGELSLTESDRVLLRDMISRSDDPAASALWVRFGGPQMVLDVAERYDLRGTAPPARPGQWGETTTTAHDLARFLSRLPVQADPYDASLLLRWMHLATPLAADGFDQRFGIFGTVPGRPAVKQGWMCCVGGKRHMHSVGVVGNRVVVLLSEVPRAVSYTAARSALNAAAAALPPPHQ